MEVSRLSGMDNDLFTYKVEVATSHIRGDDEVELTDEESSMMKMKLLKVDPDLLTKDITGFKIYDDYKNNWIYEWNKDVPWVNEKPWTDTRV
ncbi:hypothetical protein Tco_0930435 [Tanacetum coccineum]